MREASNGSAGILCFLPVTSDPIHQQADMADSAVVQEFEVTQEETTQQEMVLLPMTLPELAENVEEEAFLPAAISPLSDNVIEAVSNLTREQEKSDLWFQFRVGRITASKLYDVARKVNSETGVVSQRNDSFLKQVMNYSPPVYSPAIHWGKYNEKLAVQKFFRLNRRKHKKLEIKQCGVILYDFNPIIAASPDALVSCVCCGTYPLEVKNPYKHRNLSINKFAEQPESCLHINFDGVVQLKVDHPYYYQVQAQMLATKSDKGYFALKTVSPYNNFFCQEICFDPMFMEEVVAKATKVFECVIMPELIHKHLKTRMAQDEEVDESDQVPTFDSPTPHEIDQVPTKLGPQSPTGLQPDTAPVDSLTPYVMSSAVEFECNVCHLECIDEPNEFKDMSIYCDKCTNWYHWVCVGVKGTELFLKRKRMKWFCISCDGKKKEKTRKE